jgi:hypothetical protein
MQGTITWTDPTSRFMPVRWLVEAPSSPYWTIATSVAAPSGELFNKAVTQFLDFTFR